MDTKSMGFGLLSKGMQRQIVETVIYFQNPEMCDEQSYWIREEGDPVPEAGEGSDGWIGGAGWPIEYMVKGEIENNSGQFVRECLGLEGPYRCEYVNIRD